MADQVLIQRSPLVSRGVFVAGTLSPEHQESRWYNYLAAFPLIKWMVPKDMQASNIEMMVLSSELSRFQGQHNEIEVPITLIQGSEDVLVPFETVEYYQSVKKSGVEYILIDGMNHFIPWSDPSIITQALLAP